jgi:hypothetical protein
MLYFCKCNWRGRKFFCYNLFYIQSIFYALPTTGIPTVAVATITNTPQKSRFTDSSSLLTCKHDLKKGNCRPKFGDTKRQKPIVLY